MTGTPRGLRSNNPGNIRKTPTHWQGEVEGEDSAFETFETPVMGIRAMVKIWRTYRRQAFGALTYRALVQRWAPPTENDTDEYVSFVCGRCNAEPDDIVPVGNYIPTGQALEHLVDLVEAIITFENGQQPYTRDLIVSAIERAYE